MAREGGREGERQRERDRQRERERGSSITKGGGTFRINEETVIGAEGRKTKRLRERDS